MLPQMYRNQILYNPNTVIANTRNITIPFLLIIFAIFIIPPCFNNIHISCCF